MILLGQIADIALVALLVVSGVFGLIGSFGLWKLREPMQRLHAPTKASTVGVGAALIASAIAAQTQHDTASWPEILVVVFLFLTAPVSAMFLAKVQLHKHLDRDTVPSPGSGRVWATFDVPKADAPNELLSLTLPGSPDKTTNDPRA